MKFFVIFLIFIGLSGFSILYNPASSLALSCGIPLFTESYNRHDLLFHGTLVEKETQFPDSLYQKRTILVFDTINMYKGEFNQIITVTADLSWDDYYRQGEEYVLFADREGESYFRDLCVPDYIASSAIIEFLDEYDSENSSGVGVTSLYSLVLGSERNILDTKKSLYSEMNHDESTNQIGSGYVVETTDNGLTWFGMLQVIVIATIIVIPACLIYRRRKK